MKDLSADPSILSRYHMVSKKESSVLKSIINIVRDCIFTSKSPIISSNANLKLVNDSLTLQYDGIKTIEVLKHDSDANVLDIQLPLSVNCGRNKQVM